MAIEYKKYNVFTVLGDILNSAGIFVNGLVNGVMQLARDFGEGVGNIGKIFMWVGIGVAVVGAIVGLAFLGKALHNKKKKKAGGMLTGGGSFSSGGFDEKNWSRFMKNIHKNTPTNQLLLHNAWI